MQSRRGHAVLIDIVVAHDRTQAAEVYAEEPYNGEYRAVQGLMEREWRYVEREIDIRLVRSST